MIPITGDPNDPKTVYLKARAFVVKKYYQIVFSFIHNAKECACPNWQECYVFYIYLVLFDNDFELANMIMERYYEVYQWDLRLEDLNGFTPLSILERHIEEFGLEEWRPMAEFMRNKIQNWTCSIFILFWSQPLKYVTSIWQIVKVLILCR